jgi:hypothetical protein
LSFRNPGDDQMRALERAVQAGDVQASDRLMELRRREGRWDPSDPANWVALAQIAKEHGEFLYVLDPNGVPLFQVTRVELTAPNGQKWADRRQSSHDFAARLAVRALAQPGHPAPTMDYIPLYPGQPQDTLTRLGARAAIGIGNHGIYDRMQAVEEIPGLEPLLREGYFRETSAYRADPSGSYRVPTFPRIVGPNATRFRDLPIGTVFQFEHAQAEYGVRVSSPGSPYVKVGPRSYESVHDKKRYGKMHPSASVLVITPPQVNPPAKCKYHPHDPYYRCAACAPGASAIHAGEVAGFHAQKWFDIQAHPIGKMPPEYEGDIELRLAWQQGFLRGWDRSKKARPRENPGPGLGALMCVVGGNPPHDPLADIRARDIASGRVLLGQVRAARRSESAKKGAATRAARSPREREALYWKRKGDLDEFARLMGYPEGICPGCGHGRVDGWCGCDPRPHSRAKKNPLTPAEAERFASEARRHLGAAGRLTGTLRVAQAAQARALGHVISQVGPRSFAYVADALQRSAGEIASSSEDLRALPRPVPTNLRVTRSSARAFNPGAATAPRRKTVQVKDGSYKLKLPRRMLKGQITLEEALRRNIPGIHEALKSFPEFHKAPLSTKVWVIDDGRKDNVAGFLIGRTPEVTYDDVPEGSNKEGNPWVHKTSKKYPSYLVHIPKTGVTEILGHMKVSDWLREKGENKEH